MRALPPLTTFRAFEAAARLGSFRDAAEELHVTRAAISHQIRSLEVWCGQPLFRRRPLPVTLTPAGEQLFPVVRDGFDRFAEALVALKRMPSDARPIRISTTNAFAALCLVPRLPAWRRVCPDVEIEVIGTDEVLDLRAGSADVSLRYARHTPRDGVARELVRDRFFVMGTPAVSRSRSGRDWRSRPRIAYEWPHDDPLAPTWERWHAVAGERPDARSRIGMRFQQELHAIEAVLAGQGVAICSDLLLADELASGRIVRLSPIALDGFGLYLVTLPDAAVATPLRDFCDWIVRMFAPAAGTTMRAR